MDAIIIIGKIPMLNLHVVRKGRALARHAVLVERYVNSN
jgi:hypothetical protein